MAKPIVVYPGFFDPFTLGHQNIAERAAHTFEHVIVAVAGDSPKKALFSAQERLEIVQDLFRKSPNVKVERFDGLLVHYLIERKATLVVRGIRTVSDFEYEYQMALANKALAPEIETCFMMTEGHYSYLSSTVIKEIARLKGDVTPMVPKAVAERIRKKYETEQSR